MARRRSSEEEGGGLPEWMATYSDLVTLLLCFFVLLFSMASVDASKFEAVSASIRNSFSILNMSGMMNQNQGDQIISVTDKTNAPEDAEEPPPQPGSKEYEEMLQGTIDALQTQVAELEGELAETPGTSQYELTEEEKIQNEIREARQQKLNNFKKDIKEEIDRLGIGGYVAIVEEEEQLVLRLNSQILFDSGSARLRPEGRNVMLGLGESFKDLDHLIEVQGHTDTVPIHTSQFPSNWELSTQRATNVVRILQDECGVAPAQLRSTGFGEYQPIGDNTTPEGRQSNRRIDIVVTTA
ncbi:MAG: flagellar motor protein MotB [Clostridiales bacterium]|nr:flagellar motor protein MotB [Clostridiales bacterium]